MGLLLKPDPARAAGGGAHESQAPSGWLLRWGHLIPAGGQVLDVACGHGRHLRWCAAQGHRVTGVDRSQAALNASADLAAQGQARLVLADIENTPWPLLESGQPLRFDAVIVTHYLWRPLWPTLLASLAPGGVLLYETFNVDQASVGKPSNPDFLLRHGELLSLCSGLRVLAYEDGFRSGTGSFVQRIAAVLPSHEASGRLARMPD